METKNSVEYDVGDVHVHTNVIENERKKGKQEKGKDKGKIHKDIRDTREKERRRESEGETGIRLKDNRREKKRETNKGKYEKQREKQMKK